MNRKKETQNVRPSKSKTMKQLVLEGRCQEGSEDDDDDDNDDPDMDDTLNLKCKTNIMSSQIKNNIH